MNLIYTTAVTAIGGRGGRAESADGELSVNLEKPKALGGSGTGGTNPEQLFAAGYAACFASTIDFLCKQKKLPVTDNRVTAHVGLGRRPEGGFALTAKLEVQVSGIPREEVEQLIDAAHGICPYSHSIAGNVAVETVVV
jgi:Ohr subfamily peroxiredoxin